MTNGHVHILEFAKEKASLRSEPNAGCCLFPGDKYKETVKCEWSPETSAYAAKGGKLECLKWLRANGEDWEESAQDGSLCASAAEMRRLQCLKWLREEAGCEWNLYASDRAAENGNLECLQYLRENGCQWTDHTVAWAAQGGHLECLKYLREHEKEWCEPMIMFPGCKAVGLWNAEVFAKAELDFGILYDAERNAGNDVRRVGEEGLFEMLAEENVKALGEAQFSRIVTTDPHSYNTLRNEYPDLGAEHRVGHYTYDSR